MVKPPASDAPAALATAPVPLARRAARALIDVLLPRQCVRCGIVIQAGGCLCAGCWAAIRFLDRPFCARCGFPFAHGIEGAATCGACLASPPLFRRARAAMAYDDASKPLILAFKHGDRGDIARDLAAWMRRAAADILPEAELLVPVPLHWTRLFMRQYNQAALLARELSQWTGVPVAVDALHRRKRTQAMRRMGRASRAATVKGAIAVNPRRAERLRGRAVLLVDDVFTTGSTIEACAKAILGAGAGAVDVVTLARVIRSSR